MKENKNIITRLYIGSNNNTGILELEKIENILNTVYNGYTIINAVGYWNGKKENTAVVEIVNIDVKDYVIEQLKKELLQDSILVTITNLNINFK